MNPFREGAALHSPVPPGPISRAHRASTDGARVGTNVTAHQEEK